ncbi:MAG: glutamine synthetase III [Clostridia bacterium]|nr:glutamine synthetase III [Clostridia bacterium]
MNRVDKLFGINVFGDAVMKERLPENAYNELKTAISQGKSIDRKIADIVANAMKEWAIEKGATHYTHWFQPMTGITAEKHDSFIAPDGEGNIIMEFSGKELIKGESDASSFPSGGLRATFEARGYTAWDPSSYAFVKDNTLCIPTAFCSYNGEALDQKTPLLRSMEAISKQALRIAKLFGLSDVTSINTTVGPEQEYFLVDSEMAKRRPDLIFCGRTLLGSAPPKGQEMYDHYFGVIKPRVKAFMRELDEELWKLGVFAKTEHNEAAPAQHELAPIFTTTNIAADHNQLTMEMMKKIAEKHGLLCLLHEKPFKDVSGSGKHNNWSLSTNTGINFLKAGKNPSDNLLFLLTLAAVIRAVDEHQDLLRISVATAGNDHRLGGAEAPPAIISMYLGDDLNEILESIERGEHHIDSDKVKMTVGTEIIPYIRKDNTDRNRTSPFAFTGNKFEFRMLGSAASISETNVVLNTIVADVFKDFADKLEGSNDFENDVLKLVRDTVKAHKRIIFNGDGYSKAWEEEAAKRGLLNLRSTVDALPYWRSKENIALFERHGVYTCAEINCRADISLESYSKTVHIEALTMLQMVKRDVIPAISAYEYVLCSTVEKKRSISGDINCDAEVEVIEKLATFNEHLNRLVKELETAVDKSQATADLLARAKGYCGKVLFIMDNIRHITDEAETIVASEYWPYPTYGDILFNI